MFIKYLIKFNLNKYNIELININIKVKMINNIIVLNIYSLMKIDNLLFYFKR